MSHTPVLHLIYLFICPCIFLSVNACAGDIRVKRQIAGRTRNYLFSLLGGEMLKIIVIWLEGEDGEPEWDLGENLETFVLQCWRHGAQGCLHGQSLVSERNRKVQTVVFHLFKTSILQNVALKLINVLFFWTITQLENVMFKHCY